MLNKSAWGQTQAETDTSSLTAAIGTPGTNSEMTFNYRIRLFSARPIREAFARQVLLNNSKIQRSQLENFVIGDYSEIIVVAVTWDGADRRYTGIIGQAFEVASTGAIKNKVYLERKDGKRVELEEYARPATDGTGAKFVFPRMLEGKPFVSEGDEYFRFVADMGRGVRMNWRFKLSEMKYDGKLEY